MKLKNGLTIVLHITGWALFLALPFFLRPNPAQFQPIHPYPHAEHTNAIYFPLVTNVLVLPFFYLNLYVFFPKYIPIQKYGRFVLVQLIFLVIIYFVKEFVFRMVLTDRFIGPPRPDLRDFFFIFVYLFVTLLAFSYGMIRENIRKERTQKEREHENMKSELQFLRWQVNPHFLFNVLNNIVSLARMRSDKLEPVLIKLSTLMRYMLYESTGHKIPISKEIDYLQSYIDLQRLRVGNNVEIKVDLDPVNNSSLSIEPMLLIPIIENAFKHGIGIVKAPHIEIRMSVSGFILHFDVKNRYNSDSTSKLDDVSGIGLANLKRRLELIYTHKYMLRIEAGEFYDVSLKIDLH